MAQEFAQIYGFNPPIEMSESDINIAITLSQKLDATNEDLKNSIYQHNPIKKFHKNLKNVKINSIKQYAGYQVIDYTFGNVYMIKKDDVIFFDENLNRSLYEGGTSLFEISHFDKIKILLVTTNVPIQYLNLPKKYKHMIVQAKFYYGYEISISLAKDYPKVSTFYKIDPKFVYKEYESIKDCQTDNYNLEINTLKIFKHAKKDGYSEILPFLLEKVFIES